MASVVIMVVGLLSLDRMIALNYMDPTAAAQEAANKDGQDVDVIQLKGYEATGGMFGSRAVVRYYLSESDEELLEVHLKRPLLSKEWKVVSVAKK